ncbi:MAG: thiamine-phosphate kinase [Rhodospirillaceae bacterium]
MAEPEGEFDLIARLFKPLAADHPGGLGLGDDAAVLSPPSGQDLVVTSDALVGGRHFLADDPPETVAAKALGVNLSDLAAMGADPLAYTLAACWPADATTAWIEAFAGGLAATQRAHGIHLVGGDTVRTPGPMTLTVTAFGLVPTGQALRRNGARPGDRVFVSGTIGDAALGLHLLSGNAPLTEAADRKWLIARYRRPTPRLDLGRRLRGTASAAIDVSDGLVADVRHLAEESGCRMEIVASAVPVSDATRRRVADDTALSAAVFGGGDDYELAFTAPPAATDAIAGIAAETGVPLTEIGTVSEAGGQGPDVTLRGADGAVLDYGPGGYRHF